MGLIRKSLRVATLPLGPAGVKGSSKKQRVAKGQLKELKAQTRLMRESELGTARIQNAELTVKICATRLKRARRSSNEIKIEEAELKLAAAEVALAEMRAKYGA